MLIAGLGNPGREYQDTRHNIGFMAADALCSRFKVSFGQMKHKAVSTVFSFKGETHHLVKPQTYMNLSGESVSQFLSSLQLHPSELLVILDDINLPVGRLRLRPSGSDGGHNGLKSIIGYIGRDFWRLRIGVGLPEAQGQSGNHDLVSHVLGPFSSTDVKILEKVLSEIPDLVSMVLLGMGNRAMGRFNGRDFAAPPAPPGSDTPPKPVSSG